MTGGLVRASTPRKARSWRAASAVRANAEKYREKRSGRTIDGANEMAIRPEKAPTDNGRAAEMARQRLRLPIQSP